MNDKKYDQGLYISGNQILKWMLYGATKKDLRYLETSIREEIKSIRQEIQNLKK